MLNEHACWVLIFDSSLVIAQELQKIMPFAGNTAVILVVVVLGLCSRLCLLCVLVVNEIGDVTLSDGRVINNLLVVNERVLLFENIGATQHLSTLLQKEV